MGEKIQLRLDNPDVFLTSYIPENVDGARAVIICPGGGYHMVSQSEGEPIAFKFAEAGYHAYVLNYSIGEAAGLEKVARRAAAPSELEPVKDIGLAFEAVRQDLATIDQTVIASEARQSSSPHEIILCGFSAGAHAAATYAYSPSFWAKSQNPRPLPSALILAYPPIEISWLNVGSETYNVIDLISKADEASLSIPVFVWNAANDQMVDSQDSVKIVEALKAKGADCTYVRDEDGIHGRPLYKDAWFEKMLNWLEGKF
jgi:acetyl esterase/lipase